MNHEQEELAQALRTLAHREPAGPAPVLELLRRGRRARRARAVVSALSGLALAAAAVLVVGGTGPDVSPARTVPVASASPTPDGAPRSATPPAFDARSVLLAAAETAARAPATTGRYWYTRHRTFEPVRTLPTAERMKRRKAPFAATVATTQDTWHARAKDAPSRTVTGQDAKVTFRTPKDEAKWRAMGSPELVPAKPSTNDYDMRLFYLIGTHRLTVQELLRLPTGKDGLERRLRRLYDAEPASDWGGAKPEFAGYVWSTAQDLLAGPLTPATRSALYRVLAEQPGISSPGKVTDALGRTGVALARKGTGEGEGEFRLVVDDATAELLAYEFRPRGRSAPSLRMAYESLGWVGELGERL
ncbi:CU044_5270 family protein [Nonomuraea fuscirosea]|uniref:CU044_5270 family protein n=1 Tax=Nonomuraea fuscirosea TaxID=1291556 RepID=UPI002DDB6E17|nr:CU044_5270 family protein [Nonomuraea fuscirosea]WSA55158.1 CU044_5270 family protein [Nonomuraea fuscirosea]